MRGDTSEGVLYFLVRLEGPGLVQRLPSMHTFGLPTVYFASTHQLPKHSQRIAKSYFYSE